jgi:hypothetical protein
MHPALSTARVAGWRTSSSPRAPADRDPSSAACKKQQTQQTQQTQQMQQMRVTKAPHRVYHRALCLKSVMTAGASVLTTLSCRRSIEAESISGGCSGRARKTAKWARETVK